MTRKYARAHLSTLVATLFIGVLCVPATVAQDGNEREAARVRAVMFPSQLDAEEYARTRAQLMSYWMLPFNERKPLYDAAMKGEHRRGATAAQVVGLGAAMTAGNPLSASGVTRGGTALAVVSVLSLVMPRGNDAAPALSKVYIPGATRSGTELGKPHEAREEAVSLTIDAIHSAAALIDRIAKCIDGCDGDVQVWQLDGARVGVLKPLTIVWRRGDVFYSLPDHGRNAAMSFYPRFESRGLNGWVIELSEVARDHSDRPIRTERDGTQLPQLTESWARTGDGIRFLQQLTKSGHIVQGRLSDRYVAALGRVFDIGELTAAGYLAAELRP